MQKAGLRPLVNFETLPVSGFGDVLPKYFKLRSAYKVLENALQSKDCLGLVAIDYPGFNMKLTALAKNLDKPVLYVAPPQIWAWKAKRSRLFAHCEKIQLAVFFDFEWEAYRKAQCNVVKVTHPFVESAEYMNVSRSASGPVILLPGSRKGQALRNIPLFLNALERCSNKDLLANKEIILLASREALVPAFKKATLNTNLKIEIAPRSVEKRAQFFSSAAMAISAPGTATLELALAGCPTVVCTKPDFLTKFFARRSVRTEFFALPNLILQEPIFPEFILETRPLAETIQNMLVKQATKKEPGYSEALLKKLKYPMNLDNLMSEFLAQFFQG